MRLKRLELQGFKSFADRVCLEFGDGITAIVGPNGSGKSNISDAVRWVLGEQSARSLRGHKMEDVIFAGSDGKRPLGMAEVQLTLDNTQGFLPLDYSEVMITRRVYRSGDSEFLINKQPCRLKDIQELFTDTGLGREGYAIIGQGQIDAVLSVRSQDRRVLLEETAGIIKYRSRKEEALAKMEETSLDLMRVTDILHELEGQLEPLQSQAEKARAYHSLADKLLEVELDYYALALRDIEQRQKEGKERYKEAESHLLQWTSRSESYEKDCAELEKEIAHIEHQLEVKQNENFQLTEEHNQAVHNIQLNEERLHNNEARFSKLQEVIGEKEEDIADLSNQKRTVEGKVQTTAHKVQNLETAIAQTEQEAEQLRKTYKQTQADVERLKDEFLDFMRDLAEKRNFQRNFHSQEKSLLAQLETACIDLEKTQEEISQGKSELEQNRLAQNQEEESKSRLAREIKKTEAARTDHAGQLEKLQRTIQKLMDQYTQIKSRLKTLQELEEDYEGYSYSVRRLMQNPEMKSLTLGTVADVISVPKGLETAFEVALGSALQNVITSTEQEAKTLIEWLKAVRGGRATFLPLASMESVRFPQRIQPLLNQEGVLGTGVELLKFDKRFEPAIGSLLGRTVITEDLDTALALKSRLKQFSRIVTRDGSVVFPSGAMTGGSLSNRTSGLLTRKGEIDELKSKMTLLKGKIQNHREKEGDLTAAVKEIYHQLEKLSQEEIQSQMCLQRLAQTDSQIREQLTRLTGTEKGLSHKIEELREVLNALRMEQETAATRVEGLEQEEQVQRALILQKEQAVKECSEQLRKKHDEITALKVKLAELKGEWQNLRTQLSNIEELYETAVRVRQESCSEQQLLLEEKERFQNEIVVNQGEIARCEIEKAEIAKAIDELKEKKLDRQSTLTQTRIWLKEAQRNQTQTERVLYKLEVELSALEKEETRIIGLLKDREVIPEQVTERIVQADQAVLRKSIDSLRKEIRDLGMVNPGAAEEYEKVKERCDFLRIQLTDLNEARDSLTDVISEMDTVCKKRLQETFDQVRIEFQKLFSYLFQGGKADLVLTDPDSILTTGIEIMAQPPGKKLQNLLLLSGGERALTAIALLFAIRKVKPTPFCILDEIDAALDETNLHRFAQMMKEFSRTTQMLAITHRQGTMEAAHTLYGVTMTQDAVSQIISVSMN